MPSAGNKGFVGFLLFLDEGQSQTELVWTEGWLLSCEVGSRETVTHAEELWREAKSKKPDLRGRKNLGLKRTEHFVSQDCSELDGKQAVG